jgi:hypothetical protein
LADAAEHAATFLARHVRGDRGEYGHCDEIQLTADERRRGWEATDDSGKINKRNLVTRRANIMMEYTTSQGRRLWVIACPDRRRAKTALLPGEYRLTVVCRLSRRSDKRSPRRSSRLPSRQRTRPDP